LGWFAAKAALTALTLGLAFATPPSSAQGSPLSQEELEARLASGPALADLVAYAARANPMVRSARYEWRAAVERRRVATGLPDPELMVEQSDPVEEMWMGRVTQMVPFPGKLSRAGAVAEADARVARLGTDRAARDAALEVSEAFHELAYVRKARAVIAGNRELLEHLRTVAETGFVRDRATLVDVTRAQSQLAQLRYDALLMEELQETLTARLNAALGRPPEAPLGPLAEEPPRPLAYSLEEIHALAREGRDEVRIAEARIARADAEERLMGYERLPDFTVGLLRDPLDRGGRDSVGLIAGMTLPLWPGKNAGRVAEARAMAESARAMRDGQLYETNARVREAYFRLRNAERLVALYRDELLPQAANALAVAETWYRQGQGSFSDFAETQAAHYNFQLALARASSDRGTALARLERLAGRDLTVRPEAGEEAPR
jgi:outer membrane protein TolC